MIAQRKLDDERHLKHVDSEFQLCWILLLSFGMCFAPAYCGIFMQYILPILGTVIWPFAHILHTRSFTKQFNISPFQFPSSVQGHKGWATNTLHSWLSY